MTHREAVGRWLSRRNLGVEIGAFKTPIPGISPYYVDCFEEYAGETCILDFKGDACHLPFVDNSLEYVASSHVLEHVANPVLALKEWGRVLKPGGIIYAVIPDKRFTWDRGRQPTTVSHLVEDFRNGVDQRDPTHIQEFIDGIVWTEFAPGKTATERERYRLSLSEATKSGNEINIHFHTFVPENFPRIIEAINENQLLPYHYHLLDVVEQFPENTPNGFLVVIEVHKYSLADKLAALLNTLRCRRNALKAVRPGTRRYRRDNI